MPTTRHNAQASRALPALLVAAGVLIGTVETTRGEAPDLAEAAPRFWRPLAPEPHPYTAEPGTVQIELDPLSYATDRHRDVRTHRFEVPVRFKLGVAHNVDVQIGVNVFDWEQTEDRAARTGERDRGFGDITLASKINMLGNDRGNDGGNNGDGDATGRAIAIMPELRLPTRRHALSSRAVEGGVLVPIAFEPVTGWEVELTPQFFADRNSADDGYHFRFTHLIVVNRELLPGVSAFVELEQTHRTEPGTSPETTLGPGLTFELDDRRVIEWGMRFGLTRAAEDWATVITLVRRF